LHDTARADMTFSARIKIGFGMGDRQSQRHGDAHIAGFLANEIDHGGAFFRFNGQSGFTASACTHQEDGRQRSDEEAPAEK
tara:strand:- start:3739 stop:3981 length:243 start_codon:yes stop_codon:yes gene_type:complete